MSPRPAPTLAQVARLARVSVSSASHILNSRSSRYREETKARVEKVARRLGYRPNRFAQAMRRRRSGAIGIIQHAGLLQAAVQKANQAALAVVTAGYEVLNADVLWRPQGVQMACSSMLDARVEGLVLVDPPAGFPSSELRRFRDARIPVVALGGARFPGVPQVRVDARQGMRDLTQHLLGLGHRDLCLLIPRMDGGRDEASCWPSLERERGFRDALAAAGVSPRGAEVVLAESPNEAMHPYQNGRAAMRELLRRPRLPRAVLCSNDDWAVGALNACAERRIRVPEDLALTGFDNSMIGEFSMVPLTTVAQPVEAMARRAMEILARLIRAERPREEDRLVRIAGELVVRRSCGSGATRRPAR
jgi:LacI family transcriptional regulator